MGEGELISAGIFSPSVIEQTLIKGKDGETERRRDKGTRGQGDKEI
jgi:hypothetical protein